jgi:hypothetical protein
MSMKRGAATLGAIVFLFYGVEVAHASGIGDVADDVSAVTEIALPEPEDATMGDVVEQATATVGEAVADPTGVVESTVEQATGTVAEAAADVGQIVESSHVAKAAPSVADIVSPVAPPVAAPAENVEASGSEETGSPPLREPPDEETRSAGPARPAARAKRPRIVIGLIVAASTTRARRPLSTDTLVPPRSAPRKDAFGAPEPTTSEKASSAVTEAPLAPPPPGDQPATAAFISGAAGAALLAALLGALLVSSPRTGRLTRARPPLLRPEPCLSLPERPG